MGMADALITRLGSVRKLTVRPTSSVSRLVGGNDDPLEVGRSLASMLYSREVCSERMEEFELR
jgi:hypothetical protein